MCGIGALLDPAGSAPADAGRRMAAAMRHRGPDGDGVRQIGPATLAHTRLAIIDVAGGDQPLDLRGRLDHRDRERGDLQPPRPARGAGGGGAHVRHPLRLRGGGARLRAARRGLRAADERHLRLRALGRPARPPGLRARPAGREAALLALGRPPDRGGVRGARPARRGPGRSRGSTRSASTTTSPAASCRRRARSSRGSPSCRAATTLTAEPGSPPVVTSYREAPGAPLEDLADEELAAELAERFTDAVERQMMSDVPYGAFLSGGMDSAAIAAAMADRSEAQPDHVHDRLPRPRRGDRRARGRGGVRAHRGDRSPRHHRGRGRTSWASSSSCVRSLEEPLGIPSAPALMQLSHFAAQDVKVVLSGQGADEPHGGYARHRARVRARARGEAGSAGRARCARWRRSPRAGRASCARAACWATCRWRSACGG